MKAQSVDTLYEKLFTRYLPGSHVWFNKYRYCEAPKGKIETEKKIQSLIDSGHVIRCAYTATAIRGYHNRWIFFFKSNE